MFNYDDIIKERVRVMNWFLTLPETLLNRTKKEVDEEWETKQPDPTIDDDLSIWDVDDIL